MNLLLTSAGRRGYLLTYFKEALAGTGLVHAGNSHAHAAAFHDADRVVITPLIHSPEYVDFLLSYCAQHNIRAIIPLFDVDVPVLARNASRFESANIVLVASTTEVAHICADKWETYKFLGRGEFNPPLTFLSLKQAQQAFAEGTLHFPVIVKPRWGAGSIGIFRADNAAELPVLFRKVEQCADQSDLKYQSAETRGHNVLIQTFIQGQEYGLDVVNDLQGRYLATFVKKKLAMRAGETDVALTVADPVLERLGASLGRWLKHRGNLDVDVLVDEFGPHVLEMNARFGGGYPFSHLAGADIPRAILSWIRGVPADPTCFTMIPGVEGFKAVCPMIRRHSVAS